MKKYYLCGPTVYDEPHIGNMRPILTFDILIRSQRYLGEQIFLLHNVTDIDDKIINKAIQTNTDETHVAQMYTNRYFELLEKLNIQKPNKICKVTESINLIDKFISKLIQNDSAYKVGSDVFFNIQKHSEYYGELSNQKIENMEYEDQTYDKKHPADFALWKDTKVGIKYDSSFGRGRPGWHTECVAMISEYLGHETIDLHGGGADLKFPHHENENIQFRALTNKPLAKEWIHFGTINVEGQKMSKSLGNVITAIDFLDKYNCDTLRLILLTSGVTKPINITQEVIESNNALITKFDNIVKKYLLEEKQQSIDDNIVNSIINEAAQMNFANVMKQLHTLSKNKNNTPTFVFVLKTLGFGIGDTKLTNEQKQVYANWKEMIKNKNYVEADKLREQLKIWNMN
ncbi:class I tRNA ligase family protein [Mycoplasma phocoenae]|uniref:Class I tRNA ligase family protein n=1 Tax=Mycoplasma phocoenae TaxID=754517 RepID=A0A858U4E2_9MOLU|nr:class I tRNA ligase family protein [Mycoplasma phocoenae]QJG66901.1 class I tRNA ligase family protein [Mycoplasma phocoenae]